MMGELIGIADQIESELRDFFSPFKRFIRGVALDVDDYWEVTESAYHWGDIPFLLDGRHLDVLSAKRFLRQVHGLGTPKAALGFRPPNWKEHCRAMGYPQDADPVVVRAYLRQESSGEIRDFPRSFGKHPIVYEVRQENRALSWSLSWIAEKLRLSGSDRKAPSIGGTNPNTAGTLGGLLYGGNGDRKYLVTCAHVLGEVGTDAYHPGPFEGKRSQAIASVVYRQLPGIMMGHESCSERTMPGAPSLDLAVAELRVETESIGQMGAIEPVNDICSIGQMRRNDRVSFTGKVSGVVEAKLGPLTLWDQIRFPDDSLRCFGRIFQIDLPTVSYVREVLAAPGDSGSWVVLRTGDLAKWYGMVISCDGGTAYACFAEYILEQCTLSGAFPGGLRLKS
jgi:hypothetical protein